MLYHQSTAGRSRCRVDEQRTARRDNAKAREKERIREGGRERERTRDNSLPQEKREGLVVGALEDLFLLPALDRLHPFLTWAAPILGYERHPSRYAHTTVIQSRRNGARTDVRATTESRRHSYTATPRKGAETRTSPCPRTPNVYVASCSTAPSLSCAPSAHGFV